MTVTFKLDLGMVKMYHHTKREVSMSKLSPNRHTDRNTGTQTETDRQTDTHTQSAKTVQYVLEIYPL